MQLQRLPGTYPYPDTIPDIRIFRIYRGETQGSYAQLRAAALESSHVAAVDIELTDFSSSDEGAASTILTAMISCVQCAVGEIFGSRGILTRYF